MENFKTCTVCKTEYPATLEYFSKCKTGKYGLRGKCKECRKILNLPYKQSYYNRNKKLVCQRTATYQKLHKDMANIKTHRYTANKFLLQSNFTNEQWTQCKIYFDNKCCYCGKDRKLTQEHFVAVSKLGEFTNNNIICACQSCNSSKQDKDFFDWYPTHKSYSKKREKIILKFLGYADQNQQLKII